MWEAPVPQFFFDYFDGNRLEVAAADDGLELPDANVAYLEAFRAATDIWGEALRERRNPSQDYFRVRDRTGAVVLELPFAEVLESSKGARLEPPRKPDTPHVLPNATDRAWRHVSKGRRIVKEQRNRVDRLKAQGRDSSNAEHLLGVFSRSLALLEDNLRTTQRQHTAH